MEKMAFIYLSNYDDWPLGGMLNYVNNLIPYLEKNDRWEVDIWGGQLLGCVNSKSNVKIYTTIKTNKKILPNFVRSFFGVLKNRNKFKDYDIVYSHTSATSIAMKLCFPKKFVVHHQHGLSYKENRGFVKILNIGYTIAQILSNITIFVASDKDVYEHSTNNIFKNKKFYSIGSPIDYKGILNKSNEKNVSDLKKFVYTGRIDEWKNITLLVEAFKQYHKKFADSILFIVGDGPFFEIIQKKIAEEKCDNYIILTGRKKHSEIVDYLVNGDVFLFPSKGEGVSLSILEAFSAGLPVVGFDVTGVRDLVINNYTGILVDDMTVEYFAKGIEDGYNIRKKLRTNCQNFASDHDSSKLEQKISDIIYKEYRSFINEKNSY